jgi:GT2 family glycosyltransferase
MKKPDPKVTIIIPQKGNVHLTQACVKGIVKHHLPFAGTGYLHLVVVNDDEGPCPVIEHAEVIPNARDGVTAAWNTGIEHAKHGAVILLNNDVIVEGPWIVPMVLKATERAIVGVRFRREILLGREVKQLPGGTSSKWLEGWCWAFKKEVWDELGGFDERMRLYFSDLDFQARAVNAGMKLDAAKDLPLHYLCHKTAETLPDKQKLWDKDRAAFAKKIRASY